MALPHRRGISLLVLLCVFVIGISGQDNPRVNPQDGCEKYMVKPPSSGNSTAGVLTQSILLWQGIVLLICFGAFALFICLIHRIVRTYIFYDAHLLDTFFDGGGDINFGLIACSVVAKYAWTSTFTWSTNSTAEYGLVGHFWYAAGAAIHLFLFAIVACEIRIKAPGAKTYLQVIYARFGAVPHIIVMIFAFICNVIICGMVMSEGVRILTGLTQYLGQEVTVIVLCIVIGFFTVVGGVGGGIYVAYFSCAVIMSVILVFLCDIFWDPLSRDGNQFGSIEIMYDIIKCGKGHEENENFSLLTFLSRGGMIEGVIIILSSFASVFVNQSFWQTAVAAKPPHTVWGFITGGLAWFAIPFCSSFAFGLAYWAMTITEGQELVSDEQVLYGFVPAYVSQRLLANTGDFLMFTITMVAVVTTVSGEVLASSSIIVYDIYQTYISPFRSTPVPDDKQMSLRMQRAIRNEEYLEYDRRSVVLKHVVVVSVTCLLIPITLVVLAIGIDLPWLFKFLGILVGSCVIPIALSITWHRITGAGLSTGAVGGFVCALVAWLVYASTFDGGLNKFRENTGRWEPVLVGTAVAVGGGGLLCMIVSLSCGGCDASLHEEEEWEKTRNVDNPILPWSVKYAPDVGAGHMCKGRPHFYTVRRAFKCSEIFAYIIGVFLSVCAVLVWPACMLTLDVFNHTVFYAWTLLVLIWAAVAAAYLIIVPLITEIVQTCQQSYYNRLWARSESRERLEEVPQEHTRPPITDTYSSKAESEFQSTIGPDSGISSHPNKERWKTFIHLD